MTDIPKRLPRVFSSWEEHNGHTDLARSRWDHCERIAEEARRQGLDASAEFVNRHYPRFRQWSEGHLATGYLMRLTGVQRKRVR